LKKLAISELFELASLKPDFLSNDLIENRIRETMRDMVEESMKDSKEAKIYLGEIKKEISSMN
jgi:hypothetical protein